LRSQQHIAAEHAGLAVIERVAGQGIAAIERGDFTLISGPDESQALLKRLNERARSRTR
jgi:antitoxin ParD1/3/4